jgi:hypothetical protein
MLILHLVADCVVNMACSSPQIHGASCRRTGQVAMRQQLWTTLDCTAVIACSEKDAALLFSTVILVGKRIGRRSLTIRLTLYSTQQQMQLHRASWNISQSCWISYNSMVNACCNRLDIVNR